MKVIFLYTEIAGYIVNCFNELANKGHEVHAVRWEVNSEAPFQFELNSNVTLYDRNKYQNADSLLSFVKSINPDKIVCSGWVDKAYLTVCKYYKNSIPTILTIDNHWTGSLKQYLARLLSPIYLQTKFSHVWVPGRKQYEFARKLGFNSTVIQTGFYTADISLFEKYFDQNKEAKTIKFPHVFLYVGRYVQHKGIFGMWEAFIQLKNEDENDWQLWCVGTGDQYENKVEHPSVKHFGFVQPDDLGEIISKSGVYILPSHFEPWGVTLQEFALAGMPLLCSEKVGAAEVFLEEEKNGFMFPANNVKKLKASMKRIIGMDDKSLLDFHYTSAEVGKKINVDIWINTLMKV
ncbi:MAG: glycosyltransferase family 4 protein [Flavobacteriales bacterium]|nr:glycosyltransferase family 4 protein [Flavobacteriales bacterium]